MHNDTLMEFFDRTVYDPCLFDLDHLEQRLDENSGRLFVSDDESCIQVIKPGNKPIRLDGLIALQTHLRQADDGEGTTLINIPQTSSVDPLVISKAGFRSLVWTLQAFPPLLELVHAFGDQPVHAPSAVSPVQIYKCAKRRTEECCFLLKHVERHGRDEGADSWSIRQIGVYSKLQENDRASTIVLLNPSKTFQRRFLDIRKDRKTTLEDIETLLLSTCLRNWTEYLDYLETHIQEKISAAIVSSPDDKDPSMRSKLINSEAQPVDIPALLRVGQRLEMVHTAISTNLEVIRRRNHFIDDCLDQRGSTLIASSKSLLQRIAGLKMRLNNALELVGRSLDIMNAQRSIQLSHTEAQNSRSLRTIAILTLLYLPASFVATLLSMNYVHVTKARPLSIAVDNEFLLFIILTLSLLILTAIMWVITNRVWRWPSRKGDTDRGIV